VSNLSRFFGRHGQDDATTRPTKRVSQSGSQPGESGVLVEPVQAWCDTIRADTAKLEAQGALSLPYKAAVTYARAAGALYVGKVCDSQGAWRENPNPAMRISEETRQAIRQALVEVVERGETYGALHAKLFPFIGTPKAVSPLLDDTGRPLVIALTELGIAENMGALANLMGLDAEFVEVMDGDGSGPNCEGCQSLSGQICTIGYALMHPLGHPCCRRAFAPVIDFDGRPDDPPKGSRFENLWVGHQY